MTTSIATSLRDLLRRSALSLGLAIALSAPLSGSAEVPFLIGYQGAVFDVQGEAVAGPVSVQVTLFDAATAGSMLYQETHPSVALIDGAFDLNIGSATSHTGVFAPEIFANASIWLELTVNGERMAPRQRLVAVPYAMRAAVADSVEGELATSDVRISGAGSQLNGASLVVQNSNVTDGVAARFSSSSAWPTAQFENSADGEVVKIYGKGVGVEDAAIRVENTLNADAWAGWFRGRTRFENTLAGGSAPYGEQRTVEIFGNGSNWENPALWVEAKSTSTGRAARFFNNSASYNSTFINNTGASVYVQGRGATRTNASLLADNPNTTNGMAAYFTNNSVVATAHFQNSGNGQVVYLQNNGTGHFIEGVDQNWNRKFYIDGTGMAHVRALEITGGADLSESFDVASVPDAPVEPGTVVSIDPARAGELAVSARAYDSAVAGIVAGAGGIEPGMLMAQNGKALADGEHPVALTGRVYAKADLSGGVIRPGDLLTTSARAGHAMRASDRERGHGAILGKAMTGLDQETGLVLVLVNLQ